MAQLPNLQQIKESCGLIDQHEYDKSLVFKKMNELPVKGKDIHLSKNVWINEDNNHDYYINKLKDDEKLKNFIYFTFSTPTNNFFVYPVPDYSQGLPYTVSEYFEPNMLCIKEDIIKEHNLIKYCTDLIIHLSEKYENMNLETFKMKSVDFVATESNEINTEILLEHVREKSFKCLSPIERKALQLEKFELFYKFRDYEAE